jgi:hypothetical protein
VCEINYFFVTVFFFTDMFLFFSCSVPLSYALLISYVALILNRQSYGLIMFCGLLLMIEASIWYYSCWPSVFLMLLFVCIHSFYHDFIFVVPSFLNGCVIFILLSHWLFIEKGLWAVHDQGYTGAKICCIVINMIVLNVVFKINAKRA